ncbi:MAG: acetyltransferase, partial [Nocardioides sp.]|nr:acetyltransferase [Nocardioides sp.]
PDAIAVDYAIGETAWLGKGIGAQILWAWLQRTRHRFSDAATCFAAPDHRNLASLRVLSKVGVEQGTWFHEAGEDGSVLTVVGCSLDLATVVG